MSTKKYLLLLAFFAMLFSTNVEAQNSGVYSLTNYDYADSSLIPSRRMAQQDDFNNHRYLFPSKPRNQWEIGISVGAVNVSGDVRSKNLFNGAKKPFETVGFAVNVRKAWGYVLSSRLQYMHGTASGYNWEQGYYGYIDHPTSHWKKAGYTGKVNYNYKSIVDNLSLDMIASLSNIRYHKTNSKTNFYALAGVGALIYETKVDVYKNGETKPGTRATDFLAIGTSLANLNSTTTGWFNRYKNRKTINTAVLNTLDGDYETRAERHGNRIPFGKEKTFRPTFNTGIGFQYKLSNRIALSLEDKVIFTMDDLIDGQRWQEWSTVGGSAMTREFDNINYLALGLNVNVGNNAVAPLWWMNPLDFAYNGLAQKSAPVVDKCAKDSDGDGISDCFDRCNDTPGGVAVDTHGCCLDTDGDGVCDYKDKELITPTSCQPSNADGIGTCPDPECCTGEIKTPCSSIGSGSINFASGSRTLSGNASSQLSSLAAAMRSNPNCKVVITGNGSGSKVDQQRSWDRVNAVINFMVDRNNIDRDRFIFQYGGAGNSSNVDYRSANNGEEGPSNTPPPFPNLKKN